MKIILFAGIAITLISCLQECSAFYCREDDEEPWSYHGRKNGPSKWGNKYATCNGNSQSPIDIKSSQATKDPQLKHLEMKNYDVPVKDADIHNNGETVRIQPEDGVVRSITINGDIYTLDHLHFHWGSRSYIGSEHRLDSRAYEMEGHFVHFNKAGAIAVVGVLFKSSYSNNQGFKPISEILSGVRFRGGRAKLRTQLDLTRFIPRFPLPIYRYSGSLTTPGCTEGVTWSVAQETVEIGRRQLNELRDLYSVEKEDKSYWCHLKNNYRPLQDLKGRKVTAST